MLKKLGLAIVCVLAAAATSVSPGMAATAPPLRLAQAADLERCQRGCDYDLETCRQAVEDANKSDDPVLQGFYNSFNLKSDQLKSCQTARRYCYRRCGRP